MEDGGMDGCRVMYLMFRLASLHEHHTFCVINECYVSHVDACLSPEGLGPFKCSTNIFKHERPHG